MHTLLDATPDAVLGLDAQARIVMINPAATGIFGVEPHQVLGSATETLLPQLSGAEVERLTGEGVLIRDGRMARLDATALRRDGTEIIYVPGNHDRPARRFCGLMLPAMLLIAPFGFAALVGLPALST